MIDDWHIAIQKLGTTGDRNNRKNMHLRRQIPQTACCTTTVPVTLYHSPQTSKPSPPIRRRIIARIILKSKGDQSNVFIRPPHLVQNCWKLNFRKDDAFVCLFPSSLSSHSKHRFWSFRCFHVLWNVPFTPIFICLWIGVYGNLGRDTSEMSKLGLEASLLHSHRWAPHSPQGSWGCPHPRVSYQPLWKLFEWLGEN